MGAGRVALDIDPRNGGDESLRDLGPLCDTVTALTGGGGQHLVFRSDGPIPDRKGARPGLDIIANGYIVAAPSRHISGRHYEWEIGRAPGQIALAQLPPVLVALAQNGRSPAEPLPERIEQGRRNELLTSLAGSMRRRGASPEAIEAALLRENDSRCEPPLSPSEVRQIVRSVGRYQPAAQDGNLICVTPDAYSPTTFHHIDAGNGELFAHLYGERVRFDHRRRRWLLFTDHWWIPDADAEIERLAKEAARRRFQAAAQIDDLKEREAEARWAIASESRMRRDATLACAASERPIADAGQGWDSDPWLLGVGNGVIDLRTGTLRDGRPEDRITMHSPVAYDPDAPCPYWLAFLERIMDGKAMLVCMSRRICVELYREILRLRPDWHDEDDDKGVMKVVMTGSASDPPEWQPHIRNKLRREFLANRFRDPSGPFKMVIVRDMWLTGFDCPSLRTMYIDKPMRAHGLMQAIARVNRVFRDKPGGLVVDYLGLAHELKAALATYTESGGTGRTAIDQQEAVAVMRQRYEVCCGLFHGFDWSKWVTGTPEERVSLLPAAQEHILVQEDGRDRVLSAVHELSQAFALAVPHEEALRIRDDVAFFQAVRASLAKRAPGEPKTEEELDHAIRQIVSRAVAPEGVVDIFAAAGLKKPDISILSEEFLTEVRGMPQQNLAVELLRKLLSGEIRTRRRKNVVQARSFAEMLEQAIRRYQNRAIEATQVIEELIALAQEMRQADRRGEDLGLSAEELAFYDALETNDSAVKVLGDNTLRTIAQELVRTVRNNVTIDWTVKESVRAKLRTVVKRILRKHGYPPDKREEAIITVLEQAEILSWELET